MGDKSENQCSQHIMQRQSKTWNGRMHKTVINPIMENVIRLNSFVKVIRTKNKRPRK